MEQLGTISIFGRIKSVTEKYEPEMKKFSTLLLCTFYDTSVTIFVKKSIKVASLLVNEGFSPRHQVIRPDRFDGAGLFIT